MGHFDINCFFDLLPSLFTFIIQLKHTKTIKFSAWNNILAMAKEQKQRFQSFNRNTGSNRRRPENDVAVASPMKILDVNNDCIEHVFNYLGLLDLINVAEASKHLRQVAIMFFAHKYQRKIVKINAYKFRSNQFPSVEITNDTIFIHKPKPAFKVLRLFGGIIRNTTMFGESSKQLDREILIYINEYCSEALESFATNCGPDFTYAVAKKPYINVEEVSIKFGRIGFVLSQFNDTFPEMRRLELIYTEFFDHQRFATKFNQLEHLKIDFNATETTAFTRTDVKKLIRLNPQLQSLSISGDFNVKFWEYIKEQLKQLKVLELSYGQDELHPHTSDPIRFECVEILTLHMGFSDRWWSPERIFSFKQLKECTITSHLTNSWINFVIANPTIEKLNIGYIHSNVLTILAEPEMVKLATELPKLTELCMTRSSCSVEAAIRFLNESQSVRKFSMILNGEEIMNDLFSKVPLQWKASKKQRFIVLERK